MTWNRLRLARTTEALRAATAYQQGELIVPTDGANANRPYIGDGVTLGGKALAFAGDNGLWQLVQRVDLLTTTTQVDIVLPNTKSLFRLTGSFLADNAAAGVSNHCAVRFSYDNGATYETGNTYGVGTTYQFGANVIGNYGVSPYGILAPWTQAMGFPGIFTALLSPGGVSKYARIQSDSSGFEASNGAVRTLYQSHCTITSARITNIRLFLLAGNFLQGSVFAVEGM